MTSPSPDGDLAAILARMTAAAQGAGVLLKERFGRPVTRATKADGSPVTEADMAANAHLEGALRGAYPDFGWLSEEGPEDPDRLGRRRAFVVDPLDGTSVFLSRAPDFCVSVGLVEDGRPVAGVVHAPMRQETFAGIVGVGATRNGLALRVRDRPVLEGAVLLAPAKLLADPRWPEPWPQVDARKVPALALRLALLAAGEADGLLAFGWKNEWDIAAGVALTLAAGGIVTDPWGAPLRFNQADPRAPGAVAAGAALHPLLVARSRVAPRP